MQVDPLSHAVAPVHVWPPHWPYLVTVPAAPLEAGAEGAVAFVGLATREVRKVLGAARLGMAVAVVLPTGAAGTLVTETTGALETAATLEARLTLVDTGAALEAAAADVAGVVLLDAGLVDTGVVEPPEEPSQLPTGPPGAV